MSCSPPTHCPIPIPILSDTLYQVSRGPSLSEIGHDRSVATPRDAGRFFFFTFSFLLLFIALLEATHTRSVSSWGPPLFPAS